jgi:hypothetical protein
MSVLWSSAPWRCLLSLLGCCPVGLVTHEDTPPFPYFHTFGLYLHLHLYELKPVKGTLFKTSDDLLMTNLALAAGLSLRVRLGPIFSK